MEADKEKQSTAKMTKRDRRLRQIKKDKKTKRR